MFKEKLKNDLDKLKPKEQVKSAILSKLKNEKIKPLYPKVISVVAACLAIILAVGVIARVNNINENVAKFEDKATDKSSYSTSQSQKENAKTTITEKFSTTQKLSNNTRANIKQAVAPTAVKPKPNKSVYDKIYKVVKNTKSYGYMFSYYAKNAKSTGAYENNAMQKAGASKDYSKTNTVVENIDEDDLLKTDGDYIYQVDEGKIKIYKADDKNTKKIKTITINDDEDDDIEGIYLFKNKLVVLSTKYKVLPFTPCKCNYCKKENEQSYTYVYIYDVKNPKEPKQKTKFIQSGYYNTSRMVGDTLYLSSNYTPEHFIDRKIKKNEKSCYLPIFYDGKKYSYQNSGCINFAENYNRLSYSIIASYNINYNLKIDDKSLFGYSDLKFVSEDNAYFTEEFYDDYKDDEYTNKTKITKFSIDKGVIKYVTAKKVDGGILNSFSMDEKDGYLRLVTTQEKDKSYNHRLVLDKKLNEVGSVKNLAKNEEIYSARFLGDYAYFVTYRNTDPLFCADLSNPSKPKIVSELKMPGFSDYLHPFGKDKLFGLGETGNGKLKIAMYDISNKAKLKEIVTKKLRSEYSEASYDHHAIMVDERRNLIAFPGEYWDWDDYDEDIQEYSYYIFKFENNKFKLKAKIELDNCFDIRGLYIDDYFYISDEGNLRVVSLNTYKQVKKV